MRLTFWPKAEGSEVARIFLSQVLEVLDVQIESKIDFRCRQATA